MELDIYIPSLSLAFEYQGKQHYETTGLFGTTDVSYNWLYGYSASASLLFLLLITSIYPLRCIGSSYIRFIKPAIKRSDPNVNYSELLS